MSNTINNKNIFNACQEMKSKLMEYKRSNIEYVQINSIGMSPIICEDSTSSKVVTDAIKIFSCFDRGRVKKIALERK